MTQQAPCNTLRTRRDDIVVLCELLNASVTFCHAFSRRDRGLAPAPDAELQALSLASAAACAAAYPVLQNAVATDKKWVATPSPELDEYELLSQAVGSSGVPFAAGGPLKKRKATRGCA